MEKLVCCVEVFILSVHVIKRIDYVTNSECSKHHLAFYWSLLFKELTNIFWLFCIIMYRYTWICAFLWNLGGAPVCRGSKWGLLYHFWLVYPSCLHVLCVSWSFCYQALSVHWLPNYARSLSLCSDSSRDAGHAPNSKTVSILIGVSCVVVLIAVLLVIFHKAERRSVNHFYFPGLVAKFCLMNLFSINDAQNFYLEFCLTSQSVALFLVGMSNTIDTTLLSDCCQKYWIVLRCCQYWFSWDPSVRSRPKNFPLHEQNWLSKLFACCDVSRALIHFGCSQLRVHTRQSF